MTMSHLGPLQFPARRDACAECVLAHRVRASVQLFCSQAVRTPAACPVCCRTRKLITHVPDLICPWQSLKPMSRCQTR